MNAEFAQTIPLRQIFEKLKLRPTQENAFRSLYPSPFQSNPITTMEVNDRENTWFDRSVTLGGGPVELISAWLKYQGLRCLEPDVLRWFRFNIGYPSLQKGIVLPERHEPIVRYNYKSPILNRALINDIERRGIPIDLARKYLYQLALTNTETGEEFAALGLKTEEGGWWIHSRYISTFIGNRSITHIRGSKRAFHAVNIFKDVFDYMTAVTSINGGALFDDESVILNSYECLDNSAAYICGFGYQKLCIWLDDSCNGVVATNNLAALSKTDGKIIIHSIKWSPSFF